MGGDEDVKARSRWVAMRQGVGGWASTPGGAKDLAVFSASVGRWCKIAVK